MKRPPELVATPLAWRFSRCFSLPVVAPYLAFYINTNGVTDTNRGAHWEFRDPCPPMRPDERWQTTGRAYMNGADCSIIFEIGPVVLQTIFSLAYRRFPPSVVARWIFVVASICFLGNYDPYFRLREGRTDVPISDRATRTDPRSKGVISHSIRIQNICDQSHAFVPL